MTLADSNERWEEKTYLPAKRNSDIIKTLRISGQLINLIVMTKAFSNFNNLIQYKKVVKATSKLVKKLGLPGNEISYSLVIEKLIYDGKLSKTSFTETEDNNKFKCKWGYYGIDILNGYGCCRQFTDIHKNIFKRLNLYSEPISCYLGKKIKLSRVFKKQPNHVANLIKYSGLLYTFDGYNRKIYTFDNGFVMTAYSHKHNHIYYKPSGDMIRHNKTKRAVIKKIKVFNQDSKLKHISEQELLDIQRKTDLKYNENKSLIQAFQNDIKPYLQKIK